MANTSPTALRDLIDEKNRELDRIADSIIDACELREDPFFGHEPDCPHYDYRACTCKAHSPTPSYKVAVIGDCMRDVWVECESTGRTEGGAPIGVYPLETTRDGGAGNVANCLSALGLGVTLYYGTTKYGYIPEKTRVLMDGGQVVRFDRYDSVRPAQLGKFPVYGYDAVVVSDYNKGSVDHIARLIIQLVDDKTKLFIHTKGDPLKWSEGVRERAIFFANVDESDKFIWSYRHCKQVVVTRGSQGTDLWEGGCVTSCCEAVPTKVVSTVGAGDSYLAGFVGNYLSSHSIKEAMQYGSACASVAISKPYTAVSYPSEIAELMERQEHQSTV